MIVSCGEALIDMVPLHGADGETGYRPLPGGSPFNVAIALARLGSRTGFLSRVSTDFFGDLLVRTLEANAVDTRLVVRGPEPSTLAFVSIAAGEEPQYAFFNIGAADRSLVAADLPEPLPDAVDCLHFGSFSLAVEPAATTLAELMRRETGHRVISLDPNVRPTLVGEREAYVRRLERLVALATVVKVSAADLEWLYPGASAEAIAVRWRDSGPALIAVTRGTDGAVALTGTTRAAVPGNRVDVVDTVGAGDTFQAGLLARLAEFGRLGRDSVSTLTEAELADALSFAGRAAAITCSRAGADPPRRAELR